MDNLFLVFDFAVRILGQALESFTSHWYTTILLFITVLGFIVSLALIFRGDRR